MKWTTRIFPTHPRSHSRCTTSTAYPRPTRIKPLMEPMTLLPPLWYAIRSQHCNKLRNLTRIDQNYRNNEHDNNNNNNAPFDLGFGLDPNTPFPQHQQQHHHHQNPPPPHSPPESLKQSSEGNLQSQSSTGVTESLGRSSSEEKDGGVVDPNKRKVQNRAAYVFPCPHPLGENEKNTIGLGW